MVVDIIFSFSYNVSKNSDRQDFMIVGQVLYKVI